MATNPFAVSYITESSYGPTDLLTRYSFLPFRHVQESLGSPNNVFLVGRKGVGKTMLLKLFEPDLMSLVYESDTKEHVEVREAMPHGAIGVYLNLASPSAKLSLFQGARQQPEWWQLAYSDYLNCILLESSLRSIERMSSVKQWRTAAGVHGDSILSPKVEDKFIEALKRESSAFDGAATLQDVRATMGTRAVSWSRFVNRDAEQPPTAPLPLGVPLFALLDAIRSAASPEKPIRLFVLVDQYESLYHQRSTIDFRPCFNEALSAASRGGTGVEFKIGTRRYSYQNLSLRSGDARIESGREMVEIDLDRLSRDYYQEFALDLYCKRLRSIGADVPVQADHEFAKHQLPAIRPREEAQLYAGSTSPGWPSRHLNHFASTWKARQFVPQDADLNAMLEGTILPRAHPLTATLACIGLSRWMRGGRVGSFMGLPRPNERSFVKVFSAYADALCARIEIRYDSGTAKTQKQDGGKQVDNFVRDAEPVALFILSSIYKNTRKVYSGIDTITRLSSNVALAFIDMLRACYDLLLLDGGNPASDPVPFKLQREAIFRVSEEWYRRIPLECDHGQTLQELIAALGQNFRRVQLEITAPKPSPNGFSVVPSDAVFVESSSNLAPRDDPGRLLMEAVSWGFLEESSHQDKTRARGRRTKYELNRVLCPYFGISELSKKDPMYVSNLGNFVRALLSSKQPKEVSGLLGEDESSKPETQGRLL